MTTTTITIETTLLQETLIALRDRQLTLIQEIRKYTKTNEALATISTRQLVFVSAAVSALEKSGQAAG